MTDSSLSFAGLMLRSGAATWQRSKRGCFAIAFLLMSALSPSWLQGQGRSVYAQSLQAVLARSYRHLELLIVDIHTLETLTDTFSRHDEAIPAGSLLKPFVALAYAHKISEPFPVVVCHGHTDHCWKAHGSMTLREAIAKSCNAYFLALARSVDPDDFTGMGLPSAPRSTPESLIGLAPAWPVAPHDLATAYALLLRGPPTPTRREIVAGMRASALRGTAALAGHHPGGVLAKTGTASCIDAICRVNGDGLVVLAVPASRPTLLVLVRKRGTTGAQAAAAAGPVLTELKALHAY